MDVVSNYEGAGSKRPTFYQRFIKFGLIKDTHVPYTLVEKKQIQKLKISNKPRNKKARHKMLRASHCDFKGNTNCCFSKLCIFSLILKISIKQIFSALFFFSLKYLFY